MLGSARLNSALTLGDPAAEAYIAATGITDPVRQALIRDFFAATKMVRPLLDYLFVFAAPTRTAALVNVCDPAFSATEKYTTGYGVDTEDGPIWVPPQPPAHTADRGYQAQMGQFGPEAWIVVNDPFMPGRELTSTSASVGVYTNLNGASRSSSGQGLATWLVSGSAGMSVDYQPSSATQINLQALMDFGAFNGSRPIGQPDGHAAAFRQGDGQGGGWNGVSSVGGVYPPVAMWGSGSQQPFRMAADPSVRTAAAWAGGYLTQTQFAALDAGLHTLLASIGASAYRP